MKQDLLGEFAKAADLPLPAGASPSSLRSALLGLGAEVPTARGIPVAVTTPPSGPPAPSPVEPFAPWGGSYLAASWSSSVESVRPSEGVRP